MPGADASDIGHRPEDDEFVDINGDGKADYACSRVVWLNTDLEILSWLAQDKTAGGIGVNGRKCPAGEPARYCSGELHGCQSRHGRPRGQVERLRRPRAKDVHRVTQTSRTSRYRFAIGLVSA
ncbi:hypothetical protein MCOR25_008060 [Pyricularia grisea]|nr:hypothetical protein MCOR25_008060 [Pyricularia grisea]